MKTSTWSRTLKGWAVAGLGLAALAQQALAVGGAYNIDFAAGRPLGYAKQYPIFRPCPPLVNGKANNPIVGARFLDSVESLMPRDLALGQIVVFDVRINVSGSVAPENGVATFTMGWDTETTSGSQFGYDESYGVYCAFIDTGDEAHNDPGGDAGVDSTTWSWTNLKQPSKPANQIVGTFQLSGLDNGDTVVLEIWMVLDKTFPDKATGNVQSELIAAETATGDTINTGAQTVPLLKVDDFADFGSIGDRVWLDPWQNPNGIQDAGESGLGNVGVDLYAVPLIGPAVLYAQTMTDGLGAYLFSGLPAGNYYVKFIPPPPPPGTTNTYMFSPQFSGSDPAVDSDAAPLTGQTPVIALAAGQAITTIDAGLWLKTTLAVVIGFEALAREDGSVAVQWQTSMEKNTLGYFVERLDEASGAYGRVNALLVPAKIMVPGVRSYEVTDAGAVPGGTYTYRLVELETTGKVNRYGPYTLTVGGGNASGEPSAPAAAEAAAPAIRALAAGDGHMVLRWTSVAGQTYRLERSGDLKSFETVAAGIPATAPENVTVVVDGAQAGFYRVTVE